MIQHCGYDVRHQTCALFQKTYYSEFLVDSNLFAASNDLDFWRSWKCQFLYEVATLADFQVGSRACSMPNDGQRSQNSRPTVEAGLR